MFSVTGTVALLISTGYWPAREDLLVGDKNFINEPLVNRDRIILPPLYIKLV